MLKLTVRNLSAPQIDAFYKLFPTLTSDEAGLVERKGSTQLVITLHPRVFRKPLPQATAGNQLGGAALINWAKNGSEALAVKQQTVLALSRKLNGLIAEEV